MGVTTFGRILLVSFWKGMGMLLSLFVVTFIANVFGASASTDAYFFARKIISGISAGLERSFHLALVPSLIRIAQEDGFQSLSRLIRKRQLILFVWSFAITVTAVFLAPYIIKILAPGFDGDQLSQATLYLRILLFTLPIAVYTAMSGAALNAFRVFSTPAFARLMPRFFVALTLISIPVAYGFEWVSYAVIMGSVVMAGVFFVLSRKAFKKLITDQSSSDILGKPQAIVGTTSGNRIAIMIIAQVHMIGSSWIDMGFASLAAVGGIAVLELGQRITNMAPGVVTNSVSTVYYTEFSNAVLNNDKAHFQQQIGASIRATLFFVAPIAGMLFLLSDMIVAALLHHGAFTQESADFTTQIIQILAPLLIVNAILGTVVAALLADHRIPQMRFMIVGTLVSLTVRIGLASALIGSMGVIAVPISSLFAMTVLLIVLYAQLSNAWKSSPIGQSLASFGKLFLAVSISMVVVFFAKDYLVDVGDSSRFLLIIFGILLAGLGGLVYLGSATLLGVEEIQLIKKIFNKRRRTNTKET